MPPARRRNAAQWLYDAFLFIWQMIMSGHGGPPRMTSWSRGAAQHWRFSQDRARNGLCLDLGLVDWLISQLDDLTTYEFVGGFTRGAVIEATQ